MVLIKNHCHLPSCFKCFHCVILLLQAAGAIHSLMSAADIVDEMVRDAAAVLQKTSARVRVQPSSRL